MHNTLTRLALVGGMLAITTLGADAHDHGGETSIDALLEADYRDDDRARDQYRNPAETLEFFGIKPNMVLGEYGPGGGWYTRILAPMVAKKGTYVGINADVETYNAGQDAERNAQRKLFPTTFPAKVTEWTGLSGDNISAVEVDEVVGRDIEVHTDERAVDVAEAEPRELEREGGGAVNPGATGRGRDAGAVRETDVEAERCRVTNVFGKTVVGAEDGRRVQTLERRDVIARLGERTNRSAIRVEPRTERQDALAGGDVLIRIHVQHAVEAVGQVGGGNNDRGHDGGVRPCRVGVVVEKVTTTLDAREVQRELGSLAGAVERGRGDVELLGSELIAHDVGHAVAGAVETSRHAGHRG